MWWQSGRSDIRYAGAIVPGGPRVHRSVRAVVSARQRLRRTWARHVPVRLPRPLYPGAIRMLHVDAVSDGPDLPIRVTYGDPDAPIWVK
jgi:hypothetical protein